MSKASNPQVLPRRLSTWLPTAPGVCVFTAALGWVKWRAQILSMRPHTCHITFTGISLAIVYNEMQMKSPSIQFNLNIIMRPPREGYVIFFACVVSVVPLFFW